VSDIPSDGTEHEPAPEPLDEQPLTTPPPPPEGVTHVTNDVQSIVATEEPTASQPLDPAEPEPLHTPIVDATPLSSQGRPSRTPWSARISLLLVAALVGGLAGHYAAPSSTKGGVSINQVTTPPGAAHLPNGISIPAIVKKVEPMIVSIDVKGSGEEDQGTGMIITSNGLVVTNNHVIAAAVGGGTITVTRTGSTKSLPATLVGTNPIDDVALIRINNASHLPTMTFGNSNDVVTGDAVVAIGNALGLAAGTPTVTSGIVSALGRTVTASSDTATETLNNMIQTDAAINPGNSGGPLVDALGEVVGVNSSIFTPSGGSVGLGFAIPINRAKRVAEDLLGHGSVRRPWVGIKLQLPESDNPRDALRSGVVIRTVVPGSPASRAGLGPGDQIMRAGTRTLHNPYDWEALLLDLRVGQSVPLLVRRDGKEETVNVTIADLPEVSAPKVEVLKELDLVTMTPAIRAEKGVRSEHGAVIYRVSGRVADELGIQDGDVIVQINRTPVDGADDAAKALNYYGGRGPIRMFFERNGQVFSTDFSIQ
jgi:S1-C subfamily serine protease